MNVPWEAVVTILLYIVAQTVGFVWWMATQTITLQFVREDLARANGLLLSIDATFATKVDVGKEIGRLDASILAAHRRIDEVKQ